MFNIGQKLTKENYTAAAVWCNQHGAHIEKQNGAYIIVGNAPAPEQPAEQKVAALERQTGLTRAIREIIVSNPLITVSEHVRAKTLEIEELAEPLRTVQDNEKTREISSVFSTVAKAEDTSAAETEATISETENIEGGGTETDVLPEGNITEGKGWWKN